MKKKYNASFYKNKKLNNINIEKRILVIFKKKKINN